MSRIRASRLSVGRVAGSNPASPTNSPPEMRGYFCFIPPACLKMHHVYIIYSPGKNVYYIGSTSNIKERIAKHNSKHKGYTSQARDWELVHSESFASKSEALKREKQLKGWKNRDRTPQKLTGVSSANMISK